MHAVILSRVPNFSFCDRSIPFFDENPDISSVTISVKPITQMNAFESYGIIMCIYIKICIIYWNEYSFSYMHPRYLRGSIIPATLCRINCHTQNSCNQWLMTIAMFYENKWFVYLNQLCLPNCYLTHDHDKCIVTSRITCLLYTSKQLPGTTPLVNEFQI